jgi:SAM-dependent methyltransferase
VVICIEVLEHLVRPDAAAREMLRVLRPSGKVIATVPNAAYWRRRADLALLGRWNPLGDDESAFRPWRDPHLRFFGRGNLEGLLCEAGFRMVTVGGHGGSWLADVPFMRRLMKRDGPGPIYSRLIRRAPSAFAQHFHAVGIRVP